MTSSPNPLHLAKTNIIVKITVIVEIIVTVIVIFIIVMIIIMIIIITESTSPCQDCPTKPRNHPPPES